MLDALKMAGALAGLMKNKDGLEAAFKRTRERLGSMRIIGSGGGGAVRAVVSGELVLVAVEIDPSAISAMATSPDARVMLQALVVDAVNDAMSKAKEAAQREIGKEAEALGLPTNIPGLQGILGGR